MGPLLKLAGWGQQLVKQGLVSMGYFNWMLRYLITGEYLALF